MVNATDLQWELQLAANRVRAQLLSLSELGLLTEGAPGVNGKRMFVRAQSPFWTFSLEWYATCVD